MHAGIARKALQSGTSDGGGPFKFWHSLDLRKIQIAGRPRTIPKIMERQQNWFPNSFIYYTQLNSAQLHNAVIHKQINLIKMNGSSNCTYPVWQSCTNGKITFFTESSSFQTQLRNEKKKKQKKKKLFIRVYRSKRKRDHCKRYCSFETRY